MRHLCTWRSLSEAGASGGWGHRRRATGEGGRAEECTTEGGGAFVPLGKQQVTRAVGGGCRSRWGAVTVGYK